MHCFHSITIRRIGCRFWLALSKVRQTTQFFILRRQVFFHISVDCCISRLDIKKHFQSRQNYSRCGPANHETRSCTLLQLRLSLWVDCRILFWWRFDCWIHSNSVWGRILLVEIWGSASSSKSFRQVDCYYNFWAIKPIPSQRRSPVGCQVDTNS